MFSETFVRLLQRPPIPKADLAEISGYDPFTLSRISGFFRDVQPHDPKAVRLARALGMEPAVAFTVEAPAPECALAEAARSLERPFFAGHRGFLTGPT